MTNTKPKSWRDQIKVHPAADKSPMMKPDKLKAVGEDIKKNGLHIPIAIFKEQKHFQPMLLAGRNRLDAMEAVGIIVRVEDYGTDSDPRVKLWMRVPNDEMWWPIKLTEVRGDEGIDPSQYVISENIHRNHLTVAEQRDVIARLLQAHPDKSDRQIAEMAKDEHKKVGRVRADLEARGAMPHVERRTDTKGRKQPTRKAAKNDDRSIEAGSDPATLSVSARERLEAAIRQHKRQLDAEFDKRLQQRLQEALHDTVLPSYNETYAIYRDLCDTRKGLMTKATYNKIASCLHPDSRNSVTEQKLSEVFQIWRGLEIRLLDETQSPTPTFALPKTYHELMALKERVEAERKAKRDARRGHADNDEASSAPATPPVGDDLNIPPCLRRT